MVYQVQLSENFVPGNYSNNVIILPEGPVDIYFSCESKLGATTVLSHIIAGFRSKSEDGGEWGHHGGLGGGGVQEWNTHNSLGETQ